VTISFSRRTLLHGVSYVQFKILSLCFVTQNSLTTPAQFLLEPLHKTNQAGKAVNTRLVSGKYPVTIL